MSIFVPQPVREPFPFGLFTVIDFRNDARFETGIEWESLAGSGVSGIASWWEACQTGGEPAGLPKGFENLNEFGEANSFTVYAGYKCSPFGYDLDRASELARLALETREQTRVEQALWTGDLGNDPNFREDTSVASGTFSPVQAISRAEQYIVDTFGSKGVIHIPRAAVVYFLKDGLVKPDGDTLYTVLGTPVVAGAGYRSTNPTTGAAGIFIVATGTLVGERGEIFDHGPQPLLDRAHNDLYGIAERNYSIGFEPEAALAVPVTVS